MAANAINASSKQTVSVDTFLTTHQVADPVAAVQPKASNNYYQDSSVSVSEESVVNTVVSYDNTISEVTGQGSYVNPYYQDSTARAGEEIAVASNQASDISAPKGKKKRIIEIHHEALAAELAMHLQQQGINFDRVHALALKTHIALSRHSAGRAHHDSSNHREDLLEEARNIKSTYNGRAYVAVMGVGMVASLLGFGVLAPSMSFIDPGLAANLKDIATPASSVSQAFTSGASLVNQGNEADRGYRQTNLQLKQALLEKANSSKQSSTESQKTGINAWKDYNESRHRVAGTVLNS